MAFLFEERTLLEPQNTLLGGSGASPEINKTYLRLGEFIQIMSNEFVGIEIAVVIVIASITLAGILIGIGQAIGSKRLEQFGLEELIQSVINAAIIGSFTVIIEVVGTISSSIVNESCSSGNVVSQLACSLNNVNNSVFLQFQQLTQILNIVGYYQNISLDFGSFALSPFVNLDSISSILSMQLLSINTIMMLGQLNAQIALFIGQNALGLIFPLGLVLRTLFATRKLGGFLISLAIGLYIFYPTFILIFPNPAQSIDEAIVEMENFTTNEYYATVPIIDLNDNYALAAKLDLMSGRCNLDDSEFYINGTMRNSTTRMVNGSSVNITIDNNGTACDVYLYAEGEGLEDNSADLTGDLTTISQMNSNAIAQSALYNVIAPIFAIIITVVFVKELTGILGGEIGIKTFASI
jgi:type II secretory pathway pseudopilin PulG